MAGVLNPALVASPAAVASAFFDMVRDDSVIDAFTNSLRAFLIAFVLGSTIGLAAGLGMGLNGMLRRAFEPWILFWLASPKSAFLPIFLLLFGIGDRMTIAFATFSAIPYVATNVISGVAMVRPLHTTVAHAFGAKRLMRIRVVVIPSAMPGIIVGLWHSSNRAVGGVLIAELFASTAGVGSLLSAYTVQSAADMLMGTIVLLMLISILLAQVWASIESRVGGWKEREVGILAP